MSTELHPDFGESSNQHLVSGAAKQYAAEASKGGATRPPVYICGFERIGRGRRSVNAATSPIFKINLHKDALSDFQRRPRGGFRHNI
jgi:hypothetical protein